MMMDVILRRCATNPCRRNLTPQSIQLANNEIVVDKLHMAGHTDTWCCQHCDLKSFKELEKCVTQCDLILLCKPKLQFYIGILNVQNKEHEDVAAHTSSHPSILRKPREVLLIHFGVNLYKRQITFA